MRRGLVRTGGVAVSVGLAAGLLAGCGPEQPWESQLASVNGAGTDSGNDNSWQPAFTPGGTAVAFQSWATDLGPIDGSHTADLYLRNLATGTTELISSNAAGTAAANGSSARPFFSADGTKVAFQSFATDLGPHDSDQTDQGEDIYWRDLTTGQTKLVTPNAAGTDSANFDSELGGISPDGDRVVFESFASDLVPGDTNDAADVFVRDVAAGTTTLLSAHAGGTGTSDGNSADPVLSKDGTKVAFSSTSSDLGATDTNGTWDAYVADLTAGTVTLVSRNGAGTDSGNGDTFAQGFSDDGTTLLVDSGASNLGPIDTNGTNDVYAFDLAIGHATLVSTNAAGTDSGDGQSIRGELSPDGAKVAFYSVADDLGPTDGPHCIVSWHPPAPPVLGRCFDIYVRDLAAGTTELVTTNADGTDSADRTDSGFPSFSPDGTKVVFESLSEDFGPSDNNGTVDVYVRDLVARTTTLVSHRQADTGSGDGASGSPRFNADGSRIVYVSYAGDVGGTDTNGLLDVYVARFAAADLGITARAAPDPVASGDDVTYTVHVVNAGPDTADDTRATLVLPEGTTFVSAGTAAGSCASPAPAAPQQVVCQLGEVAGGATVDLTVTATVDAAPGSTLTAVAGVDATTADTHRDDNTAAVSSTVAG
jgi:uncharacterized repeat protein (TIGR01451 family)